MDQETRSLIELLRDETQSRSVFDRCNAVLAVASYLDEFHGVSTITATEAEVEIITGEKR